MQRCRIALKNAEMIQKWPFNPDTKFSVESAVSKAQRFTQELMVQTHAVFSITPHTHTHTENRQNGKKRLISSHSLSATMKRLCCGVQEGINSSLFPNMTNPNTFP
jgi:hypothetical protein